MVLLGNSAKKGNKAPSKGKKIWKSWLIEKDPKKSKYISNRLSKQTTAGTITSCSAADPQLWHSWNIMSAFQVIRISVLISIYRSCWAHLTLLLSLNSWKMSTNGCSHQCETQLKPTKNKQISTRKILVENYHISNDLLSNARHKSYRPFQTQFAARLICVHVHRW